MLWSFWLALFGLPHPMDGFLAAGWLAAASFLLLFAEIVNMGIGIVALKRSRHTGLWPWVLALPVYFTLAGLAAYKALFELLVAPFYWDKTTHGLSAPVKTAAPETAAAPEAAAAAGMDATRTPQRDGMLASRPGQPTRIELEPRYESL